MENTKTLPENIELKNYDCFFAVYNNQLRPIFYIKLEILMDLFDFYKVEKHRIFEQLQENETEEIYVLKIEDMGLPFIPVQKDIVQQMICEGELIENINIDNFVNKYSNTYSYITKEYMEKSIFILNMELKKMENDIKQYNILKNIDSDGLNDISDISDSDNENGN
jgi:hypothetical protein